MNLQRDKNPHESNNCINLQRHGNSIYFNVPPYIIMNNGNNT